MVPAKPQSHSTIWRELLSEYTEALSERIIAHDEHTKSEPFAAQSKRLGRVSLSFVMTVHTCVFASTRHHTFSENSLFLRNADGWIESCAAVGSLTDIGALNAARREERFMIESMIKYVYVDQQNTSQDYEAKVAFLRDQVDRSRIDIVDDLTFWALDASERAAFIAEVRGCYVKACSFVHASESQIRLREKLNAKGRYLGFETAEEFEKRNRELFRLLDLLLVFCFECVGPSFTGDVLDAVQSVYPEWCFAKGKYTGLVIGRVT